MNFCQSMNAHEVNEVRYIKIHTPEHSLFEFQIDGKKKKKKKKKTHTHTHTHTHTPINCQALINSNWGPVNLFILLLIRKNCLSTGRSKLFYLTHIIGHFVWANLFKKKKKIRPLTDPTIWVCKRGTVKSVYFISCKEYSSAAKSILYFCTTQMLNTVVPESEFCKLVPSWGLWWYLILVLFSRKAQFHLTGCHLSE